MIVLEVVAPGPRSTLQDAGRFGGRRWGVPSCGASDAPLWRLANAVAGAGDGAAAVEFALRGPTLRAHGGPVRLALGGAAGRIEGDRARVVPPLRSVTLSEGETLVVGAAQGGAVGYVAVAGGIDAPLVLGSRSTDLRAGFGGWRGRALAAGDALPVCGPAPSGPEREAPQTPPRPTGVLRVVMGPQEAHFERDALAAFLGEVWRVSDQADRMGVRLVGPRLRHSALGADLTSEGLARGAIQVPGDGAPIVLGVDSHTIGGYPKIATVISADVAAVGQLLPGATIRFAAVDLAEAAAARAASARALAAALAAIRPVREGPDPEALLTANLVSGAVDAQAPRLPGMLEDDR